MPLSEISGNVRRSDSTARLKPPSEVGSEPGPSLPPTAISSMLRTTTELGDLGQFAFRPPRIPRSGSRIQSSRPRSGSFDASFASNPRHQRSSHMRRPGRHHGPRTVASMSGLSTRHTSRSNMSSGAYTGRSRRHPHGLHPYALQGMGGPDAGPPGLYTHRSLVTLRSNRDLMSVHSASPMMPHGQMRRPPLRASSPAYSDMRSFAGTPRPFMRAQSTVTVTSSPGSIHPRRGGIPGYRSESNASHGSLARLPSPAVSFMRNGHPGTPGPYMRSATAMLGFFYGPRSTYGNGMPSEPGLPKSPTGSTVPAYYDYSESFTEENCFSPDAAQGTHGPPLSMDQTILETIPTPPPRDAQTPFGTREGSAYNPSEMPTKHNRSSSEHSRNSKRSKYSKHSKHSFAGAIPKRVSSLAAPAIHSSPAQAVRRSKSVDSGPTSTPKAERDARRASITSRRSNTPSSTSIFFSNAARSSRDLTMLAARVHSPAPEMKSHSALIGATTPVKSSKQLAPGCAANFEGKHVSNWQLPALSFRPISFAQYSPSPSSRPRTSEATPTRQPLEILSPMPERPMSSQSRKRFSKILGIEDSYDSVGPKPYVKHTFRRQAPVLRRVEEVPDSKRSTFVPGPVSPVSPVLQGLPPPPGFNQDGTLDRDNRISQVTSHDKSTIESLLDKHIECLGLGPESDVSSEDSTSLQNQHIDIHSSTDDTIRLTSMLATAPSWPKNRPWTSSSQQPSSLALSERQRLRPRRLFASMDAGVPQTIIERSTPAYSVDSIGVRSHPSYGWQTLPSSSILAPLQDFSVSARRSGYVADVDSSEQQTRLKIKRRSQLTTSASTSSQLSDLAAHLTKQRREAAPPRRSKSELVARQTSHRRRRMRIMLRLKTKSRTLGDMLDQDLKQLAHSPTINSLSKGHRKRRSSIKSPVAGYAELSADSILPSSTTLGRGIPRSPSIPTRWSSIVAAMPKPVKRSAELVRQVSKRSNRSHRSNTSLVQPINTTRLEYHLPRHGSIPHLAPPEFGPALTASDLNLSIPYADTPSTIKPTLRETKSFFSDDSSARRQRSSLRQKFTLHSLRHALPGPSGTSGLTREIYQTDITGVKLSHSCQMKGRKSFDGQSSAADDDFVPMSDSAYRKKRFIGRIKDWWRRQCVPKKLASMKRKGVRTVPGGTGW